MKSSTQKSWISPLIGITFIAVTITGFLMMFHLKLPGVYPIHLWGGVIFAIGGMIHLLLNWREFSSYFKNSMAIWSTTIAVMALILIALFVPSNKHGERQHDRLKSNHNYQANIDSTP